MLNNFCLIYSLLSTIILGRYLSHSGLDCYLTNQEDSQHESDAKADYSIC
jgi:hypothetical protein